MSATRDLYLLLFLCAFPLSVWGAEEVLFERLLSEAEQRHPFVQTETRMAFPAGVTKAEILAAASRDWHPRVFRVTLLWPEGDGRPYLKVGCLAEVLYSREPTDAERRRYEIGGLRTGYNTIDEIKKQLSSVSDPSAWGRAVLSAEIRLVGRDIYLSKRDGKLTAYVQPELDVVRLGEDLILQAKWENWRKEALQRLVLGRDFAGFRFVGPPFAAFGRVVDTYRGPKNESVSARIREGVDRPISLHQFLDRFIKDKCKIIKTDFGYVVVSQDIYRGRPDRWAVSWRSGDRHVVSIYGLGIVPFALAPLYGEKFPSTLPRKFKIDKRAWGRAEMERILAEMKACLEREDRPKDPYNPYAPPWTPFRLFMGKLKGYKVYVPLAQEMIQSLDHQTPLEEKLRMLEHLTQWWQENKKKTYWHKREQCLVAKKQSKREIAEKRQREAKKRAKQELADRINAPLSEQEIKAAKEKLAADFARDLDIGFQRKEMKDSPRINELFFRREGDRWIRSRPDPFGAGRIIRTFEIISFKRQEKKRRALRVEVRDRKLRTRQNVYDEWDVIYEYDKIRGVWDKTKTTHLGRRQVHGQSK